MNRISIVPIVAILALSRVARQVWLTQRPRASEWQDEWKWLLTICF